MKETRLQQKLPPVPLAKHGRVTQQKCGLIACRESSQEKSLGGSRPVPSPRDLGRSPEPRPECRRADSIHRPSTGKPDAGNPPVRFGGRGGTAVPSLPLSPKGLAVQTLSSTLS